MTSIDLHATNSHRGGQGFKSPQLHPAIMVFDQVRSSSDRPHPSSSGGAFWVVGRNLGDHLLPVLRCGCVLLGDSRCCWVGLVGSLAVRREESIKQRNGRMRMDGGAGPEGIVPAGLEHGLEVVAHPVGGVGVKAALAWYLVAKPLLGKDLRNAVFGHPGLMT